MSAELRYRVYDKVEKCYSDKAFSIDRFGDCYVQDEEGYWEAIDEERYVVERCTGLKDKNDKKIYEGDIFIVGRGSVNGVVSFEKMCDSDCDWYYLGWGVNGVSLLEWSDMGEVIGNIHENPELLGEEK